MTTTIITTTTTATSPGSVCTLGRGCGLLRDPDPAGMELGSALRPNQQQLCLQCCLKFGSVGSRELNSPRQQHRCNGRGPQLISDRRVSNHLDCPRDDMPLSQARRVSCSATCLSNVSAQPAPARMINEHQR
ncbi:unnamed protein product [Arctogadus glacialis]